MTQTTRNVVIVAGVLAVVIAAAVIRQPGRQGSSALVAGPATQLAAASAASTQPSARLPRLVDLGADKCIPCKKMAPILAELKREYAGRAVVEFIDVWKDPEAGEPYDIRLIPTQIFFDRDGKEVWRHEGFLPKDEIVAKLKELGAA